MLVVTGLACATWLMASNASEAGRMVEQGGVKVDGAVIADKGLKLVEKLSRTIEAHYAWMEKSMGKQKLAALYALLDELIELENPK